VAGDYASELESVARELRRQADGALFRDMTRALRDGAEPAEKRIRRGIETGALPRRGGYAEELEADLDLFVSVSTTGRDPGVTMIGRPRGLVKVPYRRMGDRSLKRLDRGVLWHPAWPHHTPRTDWEWVEQDVTPGFFTRPCLESGPEVERNLELVLEAVGNEVDRRAAAGR
jgi:hypothetical protein